MSRRNEVAFALNAGGVDVEALSRIDLEKMRISGEHPVRNWMPKVLGPMGLRPGLEHLERIEGDTETRFVRYVREIGTSYMLAMSAAEMRILSDGVVTQVPVVSSLIDTGLWTDNSTGTADATGGATLSLVATPNYTARLRQRVNVALADRDKPNILRIVVSVGPVWLRVGSTEGGQDLIRDTRLDQGTHKIAITPTSAMTRFWVEIWSSAESTKTITQIQFESTLVGNVEADLTLPTPWTFAQLGVLRTWTEIDWIFAGDGVNWPQRIEHRGPYSWSICRHYLENGPYSPVTNSLMTIQPSAIRGNINLTASDAYWTEDHVGSLVEVQQRGKTVTETLSGADQSTDYVTITDIGAGRYFTIQATATGWTGTIVLERSLQAKEPTVWATYTRQTGTFTGNIALTTIADNLDNVVAHYRFRVTSYTAGTIAVTINHVNGSSKGIARILGYTSNTVVTAEVLQLFGNTSASREWRIGAFNDLFGHPRVPIIRDTRMYWFRGDVAYGSVVDDYTNYDDTTEGDSAPITRSVGSGSSDGVLWALDVQRLVVGTAAFESPIQASEFGEVLTPTAWTVPKASFRGSANIPAVAYDDGLFFAQRSRSRLYELSMPAGESRYRSQDISRLNPSACDPGIKRIAVQQQPMTRVYALMDDGSCVVVTFEKEDKVVAFTVIDTDGGLIEDIEVEPNEVQDNVYAIVKRNSTQRYYERLAPEAEQLDVDTCNLLDSSTVFTGTVNAVSGLERFASQTVQVWADGARLDDITITAGGSYTFSETYSRVVIGKNVEHEFLSVKLAYAANIGTALAQLKIVRRLGLVLSRSCLDGVRVGRDATNTEGLPEIVNGAVRTTSQFFTHFDDGMFPIAGDWDADARFYVACDSQSGPCTVQAVIMDIETRDDAPKQ